MSNPLKFYLGEESHYIVENYNNFSSSIFTVQYKKALQVIETYVKAVAEERIGPMEESRNNIIAFTGDRGTGKTSCMVSVLNMLDDHMKRVKDNKTFAKVDIVDPSFFDENTNIIYLVVGKMFAAFRESVDKDREKSLGEEGIIHDLMDSFSKVLSQISKMGKAPLNENDTDIHQLRNLLVTVDLKTSLKDLVDTYLKYFKKDFLVIPVDDLDNNTAQAYQMMEQIRKYLILPNVVILISFKLEQLSNVAELYFSNLYKSIYSKGKNVDIADMAQKYLLKLFPLEHRIALPDLKAMMDKELDVYKSREAKDTLLTGSSMKYTMTALIFKKTRYLFYHSTGETSPIVPTNLREYRNLLSLLCNMEDYRESKEEYNKQQFLDYFYGEWVEKHLTDEGRNIAKKLIENIEAGQFNKLVLTSLSKYKTFVDTHIQEFQELLPDDEIAEVFDSRSRRIIDSRYIRSQYEFNRILDDGNLSYNVSVGDVFAVINEWKKYVVAEEDRALLFFVESLYSIYLYHYYDEITEPQTKESSKNSSIDNTIKRLDELEGVSNYDKLVGGAFFNPNLLRLLPYEGNAKDRKSRSYRVVNIKPLKDIINTVIDGGEVSDLQFQLVEFFALTLSRRLEGKGKDSMSPFYRLIPEVYYLTNLQNLVKAVFDLGSFFVNINGIKRAYNRLHVGLYKAAENRGNSILNQLKELTISEYNLNGEYDNNRFLSWSTIRNAVILQELGKSFSYVRTGRTPSSDQIELLRDFFNQVSTFYIKTYDRADENSAYDIKFDYVKVFIELFNRMKSDEEAKALFMQVFDDMEAADSEKEAKPFIVSTIVHGLQKYVKKDTLRAKILERSSIKRDNTEFWAAFDELVTDLKIPKRMAEEVLNTLKTRFGL